MEVGAIGGAGIGGVSACAPAGVNAAASVGGTMASGAATIQMQNLINALQGFSTAEILLALMMMSGQNKSSGSGDAAMGFLAGLALGGQLGQMMNALSLSVPAAGGASDSAAGSQINVTA